MKPSKNHHVSSNFDCIVVNFNLSIENLSRLFRYLDSKEYADKYKKYESEFKQWILAKHFYPNAGFV